MKGTFVQNFIKIHYYQNTLFFNKTYKKKFPCAFPVLGGKKPGPGREAKKGRESRDPGRALFSGHGFIGELKKYEHYTVFILVD